MLRGAGSTVSTDRALVERAQGGDTVAYEQLYGAHVGRIYGLCLRMTGNPALAEDCVQEAFVRAWEKLGTFQGASAFGTWLHRIAVNEVLGVQRKERRRGFHLPVAGEEDGDGAPAVQLSAEPSDDGAQIDLEQAISELPDGARHVFVLTSVEGYSHEETAGMLGIAIGTSKAQLHRARSLLIKRLSP